MAALIVILLLVASASFAAAADQPATSPAIEQLKSAGLTGFVHLLEHADMASELESLVQNGDLTLFVPTNEALMHRTSPTLMAYLKAPSSREVLRKVLRSHLVTERISAFKWDGAHPTVEGSSPVVLRMDALAFYVSNVAVKQYNAVLMRDGAVAHAINGIIVPPSLDFLVSSKQSSNEDEEGEGRRVLQDSSAADSPAAPPSSAPPSEPPAAPPSVPPKSSARFVAGACWTVSLVTLLSAAML